MARVVQRRATTPYLLIVFVFLSLLCAILAAVFYNQQTKLQKQLDDAKKLAQEASLERDRLVNTDLSELTYVVTGRKGQGATAQVALREGQESLDTPGAKDYKNMGLAQAVRALGQKAAEKDQQVGQLQGQVQALTATVQSQVDAMKKANKDLADKLQVAQDAVKQAQDRLDQLIKSKDDQRQKELAEKDKVVDEKDKQIAAKVHELDGKNLELQQREIRINQLLQIIKDQRADVKAGELVTRKADGKVAKVVLDRNVCYINLGQRDQMVPGLPFSVYSAQTGITLEGNPKAKILVVTVGPTTSECRITESTRSDPVLEGDLIANVVYSATRTYNFVVEGEFDLYGSGKPDPSEAVQVRGLIEGFGGKVMEEVSVNTDFVVMGEEPPAPPKPAEDAPPATWAVYNEKRKKFDEYKQVKALAMSLQIPVLNTNRFLAFSGYVPKKRLTE